MPEMLSAWQTLDLSASLKSTLERFRAEMIRAAGDNLAGLVLYGGLARGRSRGKNSDANLVVLLHRMTAADLSAITPVLRAAFRSIQLQPFLMTPAEVVASAHIFSSKMLDIKEHHVVLFGEDPFAAVAIDLDDLRRDVAEALRNMRFRMRQRYVRFSQDLLDLTSALTSFARPLALETASLLRCAGKELPGEDRSTAILAAGAAAFGLDPIPLQRLAELRQSVSAPPDIRELYGRVLILLDRLIEIADNRKIG